MAYYSGQIKEGKQAYFYKMEGVLNQWLCQLPNTKNTQQHVNLTTNEVYKRYMLQTYHLKPLSSFKYTSLSTRLHEPSNGSLHFSFLAAGHTEVFNLIIAKEKPIYVQKPTTSLHNHNPTLQIHSFISEFVIFRVLSQMIVGQ